jgi:hypothetical protein
MAYNTDELEALAVNAIKQHSLTTIEEVVSFLPCSMSTFYQHKLEQSEAIKESIYKNRCSIKTELKGKWRESENPTLQISLYKLMASEEELRRLSVAKQEVSGNEGQDLKFNITVSNNAPPITEED